MYLYVLPLTFRSVEFCSMSLLFPGIMLNIFFAMQKLRKTGVETKTFLERVYWSILLSHLNTNRYYCMQRIFGPKHFKRYVDIFDFSAHVVSTNWQNHGSTFTEYPSPQFFKLVVIHRNQADLALLPPSFIFFSLMQPNICCIWHCISCKKERDKRGPLVEIYY